MSDEMYAYVIITANGNGSYDRLDEKRHDEVFDTIPKIVRKQLVTTDDINPDDLTDDWDEVETKWVGELNREEWEALRSDWFIEPDSCELTMGMITGLGHMWALNYNSHGTDWNVGGIMPVSWVDVYFCCLDEDMIERAGIEIAS